MDDLQVHVAEGLQGAVPLGDPAQRQQRHAGHPATSTLPDPSAGATSLPPARARVCHQRAATARAAPPAAADGVRPGDREAAACPGAGAGGVGATGSAKALAQLPERLLHSLPWRT
ncbi:hypothetical protein GCM10009663_36900 [Kitasatospora arboriphila]|uniref:Uncharacterized protein n=1 Tax=Kitasatospora arboriphila TaxID=258052 RepID=A0ABN1TJD3_9ACTN